MPAAASKPPAPATPEGILPPDCRHEADEPLRAIRALLAEAQRQIEDLTRPESRPGHWGLYASGLASHAKVRVSTAILHIEDLQLQAGRTAKGYVL